MDKIKIYNPLFFKYIGFFTPARRSAAREYRLTRPAPALYNRMEALYTE